MSRGRGTDIGGTLNKAGATYGTRTRVRLITRERRYLDPSDDALREFEDSIVTDDIVARLVVRGDIVPRLLWKAILALPDAFPVKLPGAIDYVAILMTLGDIRKCLPAILRARFRSLYCFDAFPQWHDLLEFIVRRLGIHCLFLSSRQAVELFAHRRVAARINWIPEAIDPAKYSWIPAASKDIDVVQFGRRYDAYHQAIAEPLRAAGRRYLFAESPAQPVFPTREEFIRGLARTKISICVPSSYTHPDRARGISTMTVRYLQSMASRCLVVGKMPADMTPLFDYLPIVEIDERRPAKQLVEILDHFDDYAELIERNHNEVIRRHTWAHRWTDMKSIIASARQEVR